MGFGHLDGQLLLVFLTVPQRSLQIYAYYEFSTKAVATNGTSWAGSHGPWACSACSTCLFTQRHHPVQECAT
jgi:hypothetical protein